MPFYPECVGLNIYDLFLRIYILSENIPVPNCVRRVYLKKIFTTIYI